MEFTIGVSEVAAGICFSAAAFGLGYIAAIRVHIEDITHNCCEEED